MSEKVVCALRCPHYLPWISKVKSLNLQSDALFQPCWSQKSIACLRSTHADLRKVELVREWCVQRTRTQAHQILKTAYCLAMEKNTMHSMMHIFHTQMRSGQYLSTPALHPKSEVSDPSLLFARSYWTKQMHSLQGNHSIVYAMFAGVILLHAWKSQVIQTPHQADKKLKGTCGKSIPSWLQEFNVSETYAEISKEILVTLCLLLHQPGQTTSKHSSVLQGFDVTLH